MGLDLSPRNIQVKVTGEVTGEEFAGTFSVKPILTHGEQLAQDSLMRDFLGPRPAEATPRAYNQATVFAALRIRVTKSPSWWSDNDMGLKLLDDSVVKSVYEAVMAVEDTFKKEIKDAAEAAKKELEKA